MMNKLICVLTVILYVGSAANMGFAQSSEIPSNETLAQWETFKEKYGENWQVRWNKYTGAPEKIYGYRYSMGMGEVASEDKAQEIAWKFISENKDLLKLNTSDLTLISTESGEGMWSVSYRQYYRNIPVRGGGVGLTMSNKSEIISIGSKFHPTISVSTTPKISKDEAIDIAKNRMGVNISTVEDVILEVLPHQSDDSITYYLTWEVRLFSEQPFVGRAYFINAITGEVIKDYDTISYLSTPTRGVALIKTLLLRALPWIIGVIAVLSAVVLILKRGSR